jgi:hypothetical protein
MPGRSAWLACGLSVASIAAVPAHVAGDAQAEGGRPAGELCSALLCVCSSVCQAEDAQLEGGAVLERAAAAAEAVADGVAVAVAAQARSDIPVQQCFFTPEDEQGVEQARATPTLIVRLLACLSVHPSIRLVGLGLGTRHGSTRVRLCSCGLQQS